MRKPTSRLNVAATFAGHPAAPVYTRPLPQLLTPAERRWRALAFPAALVGALVLGAAIVVLLNL